MKGKHLGLPLTLCLYSTAQGFKQVINHIAPPQAFSVKQVMLTQVDLVVLVIAEILSQFLLAFAYKEMAITKGEIERERERREERGGEGEKY